jgi:hypothetical protein
MGDINRLAFLQEKRPQKMTNMDMRANIDITPTKKDRD